MYGKLDVYVGNSMAEEDRRDPEKRKAELDAVEQTIGTFRLRIERVARLEHAVFLTYQGPQAVLLVLQERLRDYFIDSRLQDDAKPYRGASR